ncbi:MAG: hypothetical protein ACTSUP_04745 [Candidatus Heimdallarchaeaceae archaeon]
MISKTEKKEELIRSFKNLKKIKHYTFEDEDLILSLLDKLATSLFGSKYDYYSTPEYNEHCKNIIKEDLKREKEQYLVTKVLLTGSLF